MSYATTRARNKQRSRKLINRWTVFTSKPRASQAKGKLPRLVYTTSSRAGDMRGTQWRNKGELIKAVGNAR